MARRNRRNRNIAAKKHIKPPPTTPAPPAPSPIRKVFRFVARPVKLPGWVLVLLAWINGIPDYKSRLDFWISTREYVGRWMIALSSWLGSPILTIVLAALGVAYILFVGEPERLERRNRAFPYIAWTLVGLLAAFFIAAWGSLLTVGSWASFPRVILQGIEAHIEDKALWMYTYVRNPGDGPLVVESTAQIGFVSDRPMSVKEVDTTFDGLLRDVSLQKKSNVELLARTSMALKSVIGYPDALSSKLPHPHPHFGTYAMDVILYRVRDKEFIREACSVFVKSDWQYCEGHAGIFLAEKRPDGIYRLTPLDILQP